MLARSDNYDTYAARLWLGDFSGSDLCWLGPGGHISDCERVEHVECWRCCVVEMLLLLLSSSPPCDSSV